MHEFHVFKSNELDRQEAARIRQQNQWRREALQNRQHRWSINLNRLRQFFTKWKVGTYRKAEQPARQLRKQHL